MNIAPRQIDEALEAHPGVLEAAAVGGPDHYFGEDVVAFAVARPGLLDGTATPGLLRESVGAIEDPSRIHIVSELPKGPSGKVQPAPDRMLQGTPPGRAGERRRRQRPARLRTRGVRVAAHARRGDDRGNVGRGARRGRGGRSGQLLRAGRALALGDRRLGPPPRNSPVELSVNEFFSNATVARQAALVSERLAHNGAPAAGARLPRRSPPRQAKGRRLRRLDSAKGQAPASPLSPAQERLWFLEKLNPGFRAYNEAEAARFRGPLNVGFLEDALNAVVARHEALADGHRSFGREAGAGGAAVVEAPRRADRPDPPRGGARVRGQTAAEGRAAAALRPCRRAGDPRRFLRCGPEDHVLILTMHHMVCDGWSLPILYHELSAAYRASCRGEPLDPGPVPLHYPDFAAWKARQVEEGAYSKELAFWTDYLRGAPAALELPAKGPRPEMFTYAGEKRVYPLGRDVAEGLHRLSRREEVSLFTVLAAAFNVLLSRYSGHDDVVLGIPIANRDRPGLLTLFGFLIDFQALRTDLSGNPTFRELLGASAEASSTSTPTGRSRSTRSSSAATRRATCPRTGLPDHAGLEGPPRANAVPGAGGPFHVARRRPPRHLQIRSDAVADRRGGRRLAGGGVLHRPVQRRNDWATHRRLPGRAPGRRGRPGATPGRAARAARRATPASPGTMERHPSGLPAGRLRTRADRSPGGADAGGRGRRHGGSAADLRGTRCAGRPNRATPARPGRGAWSAGRGLPGAVARHGRGPAGRAEGRRRLRPAGPGLPARAAGRHGFRFRPGGGADATCAARPLAPT